MGQVEDYPHGTFCWVELGTTDPAAAKAFYSALLGWKYADVPGYTLSRVDGKDVAGLHSHQEQPESRSHWESSIAVDDVDVTMSSARKLGATIELEPFEIPGAARMAVIAEPSGARVNLWQAAGFAGARLVNEPGAWTWNDLATRDPDAASAFHEGMFGWSFREVAPGYWSISKGDLLIGGMRSMDTDPPETPPHWMPYFVADDLDRAGAEVERLGGRILVPVREVPSGRFLVFSDPSGAFAGLLEMGPEGPVRGVDRFRGA